MKKSGLLPVSLLCSVRCVMKAVCAPHIAFRHPILKKNFIIQRAQDLDLGVVHCAARILNRGGSF